MPTRTKLDGIIFPLSSDHRMTLLQFNVLRGMLVNHEFISLLQSDVFSIQEDGFSVRVVSNPTISGVESLPPALHPTVMQRTVAHQDWIDIIPHPILLDNVIKAAGKLDADELWSDNVGGLFEGFPTSDIDERGVVMWSPPWHVSGWEFSEGFWRKWWWLLKGYPDILKATNQWRSKRGEVPLVFEV